MRFKFKKLHINNYNSLLGESVEENANLVIRLLIRRPECLGPALRGEGEGLLRAIIDANKMSEKIADRRKVHDEAEGSTVMQFEHPLPESDDDEDYIDTGAAILNFYCTLVDLLGRCAPDSSVIEQGKILLLSKVKVSFPWIYDIIRKYHRFEHHTYIYTTFTILS